MHMLRSLFASIARKLPSKSVADLIFPWVALCSSLIGGGLALGQYTSSISNQQAAEAVKLHRDYIGSDGSKESVKDVFDSLTIMDDEFAVKIREIRCRFINKLVEDGKLKGHAVMDCNSEGSWATSQSVKLTAEQNSSLRAALTSAQNKILSAKDVGGKVYKVLAYFRQVIACVDEGGCDRNVSYRLFARDMSNFINGFCEFISARARKWGEEPEDNAVAVFLKRGEKSLLWPMSGRTLTNLQFRCTHHASL